MNARTLSAIMIIATLCLMAFVMTSDASANAKTIGKVKAVKRILQGNDVINIIRVDDPDNPFISIYFTTIKSGKMLAMADPSNSSITVRLTGNIPVKNGVRQLVTKPSANIAKVSKSIGSKTMRIARFYDKEKDVMLYLVYTTKMIGGSLKHSISAVPLNLSVK